jgi:hypothetical protein
MNQVQVSLAAIPDAIALDVSLAAKSCHKSVIIKYVARSSVDFGVFLF